MSTALCSNALTVLELHLELVLLVPAKNPDRNPIEIDMLEREKAPVVSAPEGAILKGDSYARHLSRVHPPLQQCIDKVHDGALLVRKTVVDLLLSEADVLHAEQAVPDRYTITSTELATLANITILAVS